MRTSFSLSKLCQSRASWSGLATYGALSALAVVLCSGTAFSAPQQPDALTVQTGSDIPAKVAFPTADQQRDYVKRVVMVPMRDGVKLYTVIVIPKNTRNAPILLTRTPYNAKGRANRVPNALTMRELLPQGDDVFVDGGYIRVFQDIRGKYGSEGDYVMTRPPRDR